jgi:hypothetical protein
MPRNATAQAIIDACEKHWATHQANCSGFVKAVAAEFDLALTGLANDIVDYISTNWTTLADGPAAATAAAQGLLVVAGLKEAGHGHVVVVVDGPLAQGKYPTAYWGRLGSSGKKNTTLNYSWGRSSRDSVIYRSAVPRRVPGATTPRNGPSSTNIPVPRTTR